MRDQRVAQTRARIVAAGAEILHGYPIWNWGALTVRAVAQQAGVNERTVYRYFASERALRDAVMAQLEEEAGVDLEGLTLDGLQKFTAQILEFVSSFPLEPRTPHDPTLTTADQRQRNALLGAVAGPTGEWSEVDSRIAAALFDVLWSIGTYERLVADWELDPADAIRAVTWAISVVQDAIARTAARRRSPAGPQRPGTVRSTARAACPLVAAPVDRMATSWPRAWARKAPTVQFSATAELGERVVGEVLHGVEVRDPVDVVRRSRRRSGPTAPRGRTARSSPSAGSRTPT